MSKWLHTLFITFFIISLSISAFANSSTIMQYPHATQPRKHSNKDEVRYYKATVISQIVHDPIPCMTYSISPGAYVGLNPGLRTNYSADGLSAKSLEGTLFAGYSVMSWNLYLAAEIFAQNAASLQNYSKSINNNGNPVGLRTTWGYGLSLLPGYVIADGVLAYLRSGVVHTHFQDAAKAATGGQVGLGLQAAVTENWNIRAEYIYSFYQSITYLGNPRSDQFGIGLLYKF
ncbi:MAG TPA: porin family protein [Gammaproteobacteria bacterium]|nr:porin family protein [Gammaproteobacteria bacterium]